MKKSFMAVFLVAGMSACSVLPVATPPASSAPLPRPSAPPEQRLYDEAQALSASVAKGRLTRVEVADRLDALRQQLVGRNAVDDDVFRLYRQIALRRDANQLDSTAAQQQMASRLQQWHDRWPRYSPKPSRPAFTQFMMRLYGLPALGK